jgi:UPF0716 protein FxsA
MFKIFFIVFIVTPLLELYLLIEVGSAIGALPTILFTIFTALVGGILMKNQGLMVIKEAQMNLARGQLPQQQGVEGVMIFLGGLMLLLPGLVTDFVGFLFLIPPVRVYLARRWLGRSAQSMYGGKKSFTVHAQWAESDPVSGHLRYRQVKRTGDQETVIEGEILEGKSDREAR